MSVPISARITWAVRLLTPGIPTSNRTAASWGSNSSSILAVSSLMVASA